MRVLCSGLRPSLRLGSLALAVWNTPINKNYLEILVLVKTWSGLRPLHGSFLSSSVRCRVYGIVSNEGMFDLLALSWEVPLHSCTSQDVWICPWCMYGRAFGPSIGASYPFMCIHIQDVWIWTWLSYAQAFRPHKRVSFPFLYKVGCVDVVCACTLIRLLALRAVSHLYGVCFCPSSAIFILVVTNFKIWEIPHFLHKHTVLLSLVKVWEVQHWWMGLGPLPLTEVFFAILHIREWLKTYLSITNTV